MITEYIRYNLPTGLNAQFETDYIKAKDFLQESSICMGCDLTHCEEEPQRYILRILWTSTEDHLKIFRSSEEFKGFFTLVKPYIPHIEEMQHYQPTAVSFVK
jgi:heme-degrading monooxygenase HmoA